MLGDQGNMKALIWEKIQELFANLPDGEEQSQEQKPEGTEVAIEIEPKDKAAL